MRLLFLVVARRATFINAFKHTFSHTFGPALTHNRAMLKGYISMSAGGNRENALETKRVPLERVFNGEREYLFSTRRNVRSFEWTVPEAEDLFESLTSLLDTPDKLELNSITIMEKTKTDEEAKALGKTSGLYDVHDGQQRLVSLSLLLAALRDNFSKWPDRTNDVQDIAKMIKPDKTRLKSVTRIELREQSGKLLKTILNKTDELGNSCDELSLPGLKERKELSSTDKCVLEVYEYFKKSVFDLGPDKATELLEAFKTSVFLLISIPADARIARSLVMGQTKGKNIEPVDEFKGMVCFSNIEDGDLQDSTLEKWNELCDEVGRDIVAAACILVAQAELLKSVQKNGEIDLMETFLKDKMMQDGYDGAKFFDAVVLPTSKTLKDFREGRYAVSVPEKARPSFVFLSLLSQMPIAKEIEIAVLAVLRRDMDSDGNPKIGEVNIFKKLETLALWMALTKPSPKARLKRSLDVVRHLDDPVTLDQVLRLSSEECRQCLEQLDASEFGLSPASRSVARAILERLNESELLKISQGKYIPLQGSLSLEHILPQKFSSVLSWSKDWGKDDADEWLHRLGNLALLNQKSNMKASNNPFSLKKLELDESPYPLTRRIARSDTWNLPAVQAQHKKILDLAIEVWNLK